MLVSSITFSMGWPLIISVAMELEAMALPQPKVENLASVTMPSSIFRKIFMMSPHLALPTSPTPSASSMTPTFRGWRK